LNFKFPFVPFFKGFKVPVQTIVHRSVAYVEEIPETIECRVKLDHHPTVATLIIELLDGYPVVQSFNLDWFTINDVMSVNHLIFLRNQLEWHTVRIILSFGCIFIKLGNVVAIDVIVMCHPTNYKHEPFVNYHYGWLDSVLWQRR
jgi:hypothetical protein